MTASAPVVAAGAVVTRKKGGHAEVLLVHRPKYDDWSFPKGKVDPYEHVTAAAVREVAEETGLDIRLGPPLGRQEYPMRSEGGRLKHVHYWLGRLVGGDDVHGYRYQDEIDEVAWLPLPEAAARLTYDYDRRTLAEAIALRKKSFPLIVLRHARARSRRSWRGPDPERPLTSSGAFQAEQVVPVLGAYGVAHVLSSSAHRCWTTVAPYADVADLEVEVSDALTEEAADPASVAAEVRRLLDRRQPAVLCGHRPMLPWVFEALGLEPHPLDPGAMAVVHHRKGRVVGFEHHGAPRQR